MLRKLATCLLLAALSVLPLETEELMVIGGLLNSLELNVAVKDGRAVSDGRKFVRVYEMNTGKVCLYVLVPLNGSLQIERHEYRERK